MKQKIYQEKYKKNYYVLLVNALVILWFTCLQRNVDFTSGGLGDDWNILWIIIFIFNFIMWLIFQFGINNRYTIELEGKIVKYNPNRYYYESNTFPPTKVGGFRQLSSCYQT